MLKTKLRNWVRYLGVGLLLPLFHLSAVTLEVDEATKFTLGGFVPWYVCLPGQCLRGW